MWALEEDFYGPGLGCHCGDAISFGPCKGDGMFHGQCHQESDGFIRKNIDV
jgi:hypothetical protein